MSLTTTLLCPLCAAVVDTHSHRHGVCTRCRADLTISVTPTWSAMRINRNAPFFPLVELIDGIDLPDGACVICNAPTQRLRARTCGAQQCISDLGFRNAMKRWGGDAHSPIHKPDDPKRETASLSTGRPQTPTETMD